MDNFGLEHTVCTFVYSWLHLNCITTSIFPKMLSTVSTTTRSDLMSSLKVIVVVAGLKLFPFDSLAIYISSIRIVVYTVRFSILR